MFFRIYGRNLLFVQKDDPNTGKKLDNPKITTIVPVLVWYPTDTYSMDNKGQSFPHETLPQN